MLIIVGTVLNCDDVFCSVSVYLGSKFQMFVVGQGTCTFYEMESGRTTAKASEAEAAEDGLRRRSDAPACKDQFFAT